MTKVDAIRSAAASTTTTATTITAHPSHMPPSAVIRIAEDTPLLSSKPALATPRPQHHRLPLHHASAHSSSTSTEQDKPPDDPDASDTDDPAYRRELAHLLVTFFLFTTALSVTITIRPKLILDAFKDNPSRAAAFNGTVLSLQSLLSIILSPLCGAVSDVIGRKYLFLLAHSGEFISLLIMFQFPTSLLALFVANILLISTAVYLSLIQAIIADIASKQSKKPAATFYGYIGGMVGTSFLIGPILGGVLEEHVYPLSSIHFSATFVTLAALYTYFFLPETLHSSYRPVGETSRDTLRRIVSVFKTTDINPIPRAMSFLSKSKALQYLAFMYLFEVFSGAGLQSIFYIYFSTKLDWGSLEFGYFLTIFGIAILIGQVGLTRHCIKLFGEKLSIVFGIVSIVFTYIMFAFVQSTTQTYLIVLFSILGFVVDPAIKGIVSRQVDPNLQGSLQGSFAAVGNTIKPMSPLIINLIFSLGIHIGFPGITFIVLAVAKLVALYFAWMALSSPSLL